jgi:hypothetical protein
MAAKNLNIHFSPGAFALGLFLWSHLMTQRELERQISQLTGESVQMIRNIGFSPLQPVIPIEERDEPLVVDWDLEQQTRNFNRRIC